MTDRAPGTAVSEGVRVRFAPSPTGFLHVGGARTALFNWLFAKQQGGTFILRIEDIVLLRSNGSPTYNLSCVSDDVAMRVTHVIRGDDHISNTPKQLLLYRATGATPPRFAHLPLILGPDKKRLSKRHGAVSVTEYRDKGYLPEAMFNFLALLGWSPGDGREKMSRDEMTALFRLEDINKKGAVFDEQKLEWLNSQYINDLPPGRIVALVRPELQAAGLLSRDIDDGGPRRAW